MKNPGKPTLTGRGIALRPIGAQDAAAMHASLDDPVSRRLTGTHATFTFEEVLAHCSRVETAEDRWDYAILVDDRPVGEAVLNNLSRANESASFRIAIWEAAARGRGYGTAATRRLVDFGFRAIELNRIELDVYAFNPVAQHVYESIGFQTEGILREALIWKGETVDARVMSILRRDYLAGR
ncbi:MAG: hypothetical protein AcusKO_47310 [Acuticoccus sp.]